MQIVKSLKLVGQFPYLSCNISSIETGFNISTRKVWTSIDIWTIIWKYDLSDKIKGCFFPSCNRISIIVWLHQLYSNRTFDKNLDGNYSRLLRAILNKCLSEQSSKQQLCGYLLPISQTIWRRHAGHWWLSKDKLFNNIPLRAWKHLCWLTIKILHLS